MTVEIRSDRRNDSCNPPKIDSLPVPLIPSEITQFPWLEGEQIVKLRDYQVRMNGKKMDADMSPEEFCLFFPITKEDACDFARERQDKFPDIKKPFASFISSVQTLPVLYREIFARRAINRGDFRFQPNGHSSEAK